MRLDKKKYAEIEQIFQSCLPMETEIREKLEGAYSLIKCGCSTCGEVEKEITKLEKDMSWGGQVENCSRYIGIIREIHREKRAQMRMQD